MSKLLFALPLNDEFDGYKAHTLTHPKGKPYTFLEKDNSIFELNHLKEKYHSSFITNGQKTSSKCIIRGHLGPSTFEGALFVCTNPQIVNYQYDFIESMEIETGSNAGV